MATKNMSLDEYRRTRISSLTTLTQTTWTVGEVIDDNVAVASIEEIFHKPVPIYRIEYSNGRWFEIPVTSVEFVSGYLK